MLNNKKKRHHLLVKKLDKINQPREYHQFNSTVAKISHESKSNLNDEIQ
jgi:hypothetical protein